MVPKLEEEGEVFIPPSDFRVPPVPLPPEFSQEAGGREVYLPNLLWISLLWQRGKRGDGGGSQTHPGFFLRSDPPDGKAIQNLGLFVCFLHNHICPPEDVSPRDGSF